MQYINKQQFVAQLWEQVLIQFNYRWFFGDNQDGNETLPIRMSVSWLGLEYVVRLCPVRPEQTEKSQRRGTRTCKGKFIRFHLHILNLLDWASIKASSVNKLKGNALILIFLL